MVLKRAKKKRERVSRDVEDIAIKDGERKKKAVPEVEGVPLHYTREMRDMTRSNVGSKTHHVNVFKEAMHVWRKSSLHKEVLSHITENGMVSSP